MTGFIRSVGHKSEANFTRPNDVTAYTAGDVMNDSTSAPTILTLPRVTLEEGMSSILLAVTAISSANQATKPDLRLWLFDAAPAAVNDNAALALSDAEMRTVIAVVALPAANWIAGNAGAGAAGNALCNPQALWLPITTTNLKNAMYGVVEVRNAYTPVALERFDFRLWLCD